MYMANLIVLLEKQQRLKVSIVFIFIIANSFIFEKIFIKNNIRYSQKKVETVNV